MLNPTNNYLLAINTLEHGQTGSVAVRTQVSYSLSMPCCRLPLPYSCPLCYTANIFAYNYISIKIRNLEIIFDFCDFQIPDFQKNYFNSLLSFFIFFSVSSNITSVSETVRDNALSTSLTLSSTVPNISSAYSFVPLLISLAISFAVSII